MRTHLVATCGIGLAVALGAAAGCGAEVDPTGTGEETAVTSDALSTEALPGDLVSSLDLPHDYTVRRDTRRCRHPVCGGWFVTEANTNRGEVYVSDIDVSRAGVDAARLDVADAPASLVLRGFLGPTDREHGRTLTVIDAFRGMPGFERADGDGLFTVRCTTATCDTLVARLVNTTFRDEIRHLSVAHVLAPFVSEAWLVDRIEDHGAVVAGRLLPGTVETNDAGSTLVASQVYVDLRHPTGPCLYMRHVCEAPLVATYTRDAALCLEFDACVVPGPCPMLVPECASGYTLTEWPAEPRACPAFGCDPTFLTE